VVVVIADGGDVSDVIAILVVVAALVVAVD
jgi:hypothetical protein